MKGHACLPAISRLKCLPPWLKYHSTWLKYINVLAISVACGLKNTDYAEEQSI
jgi:hypothetical protein